MTASLSIAKQYILQEKVKLYYFISCCDILFLVVSQGKSPTRLMIYCLSYSTKNKYSVSMFKDCGLFSSELPLVSMLKKIPNYNMF